MDREKRVDFIPCTDLPGQLAGYSEKAFAEVLLHRGIPPVKYSKLDLDKELKNA